MPLPFNENDDILSRKKQKRSIEHKVFIATEGLTECLYMEGIKNTLIKQRKGQSIVDLRILRRDEAIRNESDPKFNVTYLRDYVHAIITSDPDEGCSEITGALAVSSILSILIRSGEPIVSKKHKTLFHNLTEQLESSEACDKRIIVDKKKAMELIVNYLKDEGVDPEYLHELDLPEFEYLYSEDIDKICLIVDRDYQEKRKGQTYDARDEKYYEELLKLCEDTPKNMDDLKKVNLYVTTPLFEFWLLLHYPEFVNLMEKKYNEDDLWRNEKDPPRSGKRLTERILNQIQKKKFGKEYDKKEIDFNLCYSGYVANAMENIQSFEETIEGLSKKIGSNLRFLLEDVGWDCHNH